MNPTTRPRSLPYFLSPIPPKNILLTLRHQSINGNSLHSKIYSASQWMETLTMNEPHRTNYNMPNNTKSAISIHFSSDGRYFASTHGDHTVKITDFHTHAIIQTLSGHPRTPWTVKFHPNNSRYVVSGCLGFEIRLWDITTGQCLHQATLRHAIISLSFHPFGDLIAIASGNSVYLWDYQNRVPIIAIVCPTSLRCVYFTSKGTRILIGQSNATRPTPEPDITVSLTIHSIDYKKFQDEQAPLNFVSNSRLVISNAVLYNDGGFDVSSCGQYLVVVCQTTRSSGDSEQESTMLSGAIQSLDAGFLSHSSSVDRFSLHDHAINTRPTLSRTPESTVSTYLSLLSLDEDQVGVIYHQTKLEHTTPGGVTSVKLSPSGQFVLLGYGVRERELENADHRIISMHEWNKNHYISHLSSPEDDVNVAVFHPDVGEGFVFGTKQGRVIKVSSRQPEISKPRDSY